MMAAAAPAFWALSTFSVNSQLPRSIKAILPLIEPLGSGLLPSARLQPSELPSVETRCAGTYWRGPNVDGGGGGGPKPAAPISILVRLAGTGVGSVTSKMPGEMVVFLVTAPTPITFGELAGEMAVASSGPALPLAKTVTTPASTAASAAWTIGSGQARVFW